MKKYLIYLVINVFLSTITTAMQPDLTDVLEAENGSEVIHSYWDILPNELQELILWFVLTKQKPRNALIHLKSLNLSCKNFRDHLASPFLVKIIGSKFNC